ncbi:RCC1 domain-containing protein [Echinococcus granulosus]|uniref:RCC1 domain-containing protein n=1 Tax=Echinococcus granulosus TaxID=6210 RepID=W6UKX4_ECHGR|nr:RCC1 domain-containing protein [Echinococcus granulosus]EUB62180.1 RCC1 domain-containing protein [Echinococcus granulosus]
MHQGSGILPEKQNDGRKKTAPDDSNQENDPQKTLLSIHEALACMIKETRKMSAFLLAHWFGIILSISFICPGLFLSDMLGVFGRVIGANDTGGTKHLLYSDWHCSVFMSQEGVYVFCDSAKFSLSCEPRQFCSNTSHLFILSKSGNILSFSKSQHLITAANTPPFRSIAATDDELYCISADEVLSVYSLNGFPNNLNTHRPLSMKIKSVACGPGFALFLTHSGAVFSKGIGTRGQLGHGDLETRTSPELIAALTPVTVTAIACGSWHSVCLTDTGDIYTWGSNEFGQLGCPSLNLERSRNLNDPLFSSDACVNLSALPVPVDLPEDVSLVEVVIPPVCLSISSYSLLAGTALGNWVSTQNYGKCQDATPTKGPPTKLIEQVYLSRLNPSCPSVAGHGAPSSGQWNED